LIRTTQLRTFLDGFVRLVARAVLLVVLAAGLALLARTFWLPALGAWLAFPSQPRPADAIVVFGGGSNRTRYGAELYHQGLAPRIWQTGYASGAEVGTAQIRQQHIPLSAISYLAGDGTRADAGAIVAYAREQDVKRILVVTDWWHSRRAMCALHQQLGNASIEVAFAAPPSTEPGPQHWWQEQRQRNRILLELAKIGGYWLLYGQNPWDCS
jgi:uncharacterized SAM-binding protein YcdF (DUF218 family)